MHQSLSEIEGRKKEDEKYLAVAKPGLTWLRVGRISQRGARKDRDTKHCNLGVRRRCDLVTG